jgi:nucleoside-diphosphate kinase
MLFRIIRNLTGVTNGRLAQIGTIRGDYSMSYQENIVHTSDSLESAEIRIEAFF